MKRISILLADEHLQLRTLIFERLNLEPEFQVIALADSSASAVASALETHPQIILIDPRMSDGQGMEAMRKLKSALPNSEIIVLTAYADTAFQLELRNMGVRFILNKGIESYKLVELLHQAAASSLPTIAAPATA